jgi:hypothetical protein
MSTKSRLAPTVAALLVAAALSSPAAASDREARFSIEPGEVQVFMCGWGYGPIAGQRALRVHGRPLAVRSFTRTSPSGDRVAFAHQVTVREDLGRYRTILNRGRRTVDYRDECPGGAAG